MALCQAVHVAWATRQIWAEQTLEQHNYRLRALLSCRRGRPCLTLGSGYSAFMFDYSE